MHFLAERLNPRFELLELIEGRLAGDFALGDVGLQPPDTGEQVVVLVLEVLRYKKSPPADVAQDRLVRRRLAMDDTIVIGRACGRDGSDGQDGNHSKMRMTHKIRSFHGETIGCLSVAASQLR